MFAACFFSTNTTPHLAPTPEHSIMEAEVEAESRIHELQLRVEELEKLREADQAELAALRESEQTAASQLDSVKEENSRLAEQAREAQEISKNALQAKEKAEAEKRDLLDALARSDSDKQQLESEWPACHRRECLPSLPCSTRAFTDTHNACCPVR